MTERKKHPYREGENSGTGSIFDEDFVLQPDGETHGPEAFVRPDFVGFHRGQPPGGCYNGVERKREALSVKIVILGAEARYRAYQPAMPFIQQQELVFLDKDSTEAEILAAGADAEVLFVDAITVVSAALMEHMPCLRLIHSEGVAFDRIDLSAARERGIYVCNNKGCNAGAVAEQTVLLILMLLRHALEGDEAVRAGRQMEMKERCMVEGITELSACKVGLVGFGDIARAAAERLVPFGCELYYYTKRRRLPEEEKKYHVTYLPLEELAEKSDIVSLHCAVTEETRNLVDAALLRRMKPTAYLINTARGDLVDNEALRQALLEGRIAGAGLDTLSPEPVPAGHPLTALPPEVQRKVVLAPHLGGITEASFRRAHAHMWRNVEHLAAGERPDNIVNGL